MLFLILFSFAYLFFIAAVIALSRARITRLRELFKNGFAFARYGRRALTRADRLLHSSQLGLFISAVAAGAAFTLLFMPLLNAEGGELFGLKISGDLEGLAFWAMLAGYMAISLPAIHAVRVVAIAKPNRTLCILSVPLLFFSKLIEPLSDVVAYFASKIARAAGITPISEREQFASADEINELIEKSTKAGQIEEEEGEMLKQVFTFSHTVVREVMTPRKDVVSVKNDISLEDLVKLLSGEKVSRVLVIGDSLDQVLGVLHSKDLVPLTGQPVQNFDITKVMRSAVFVPNTKSVDQLLDEFKSQGKHFAVVLDEHGGVDGVVTLEDLIEELVGEILDEYDDPSESRSTVVTRSGDTLVDAGMNIEDFNDSHKLSLPEGAYDTIAGFLIESLGRIPQVGDYVEYSGSILKVEEMEENRIKLVRVSIKPAQLAA